MPTNQLSRAVNFINRLPQGLRPSLLSLLFATQVRFAGTARIRVDSLTLADMVERSRAEQAKQQGIVDFSI